MDWSSGSSLSNSCDGVGNSSDPSWDMSCTEGAVAVGMRCGLYLAGSPGCMVLVAMLIGRDQYSLPDAVLMYSNLMRRGAEVSCLRLVNSKPEHQSG